MRERSSLSFRALLIGMATSLPVLGLFYLGKQFAELPFVPFALFAWLAHVTPGGLANLFIEGMVSLILALRLGSIYQVAKLMEQIVGLLLVVLVGGVFGGVLAWALPRLHQPARQVGATAGALLFLLTLLLEASLGQPLTAIPSLAWTALLIVTWGAVLGGILERDRRRSEEPEARAVYRAGRRAFLAKVVGWSLAVAFGSWGLGRLGQERRLETGAARPLPATAPPAPPLPTHQVEPVPGTRAELTPNEQFYRIDITLIPPSIPGSTWKMEVEGLFDRPRPLTLADLMAYPAVTQPITLSCISNPVGGDLIGTSFWTGVRLGVVMKDLGLRPEARSLRLEAADGFYETVTMEDIDDPRTLLVYGMNGTTLPVSHGFPLRIYIPNRYGMKQPKWITRVVALDRKRPGYWVERGWSEEARPQIVSVIDSVASDQAVDGRVPIGGIAWAGDRGITKVEVQVDGGPWEEVTLLTPPLGPLTWVQWRFDWPKVPGRHSFRVRATSGTGTLQTEQIADTFPDGATGYSETERVFSPAERGGRPWFHPGPATRLG